MPSAARAAYSSADVLVRRRPYRRGAPRRFARGMDRARRPDARHGRGSGDGSRLTRLVPRRMGDEHGAHCVGCCFGLMLVLFVLGLMSLALMAVVAAVVFADKVLPVGDRLPRVGAAARVATGGWLALA